MLIIFGKLGKFLALEYQNFGVSFPSPYHDIRLIHSNLILNLMDFA